MKKVLTTAIIAIASLASAAPALAQNASTALQISANIDRKCSMAAPSASLALNGTDTLYNARVTFSCNFNGTPQVSANAQYGQMQQDNGTGVAYSLAVGSTPPYGTTGFVPGSTLKGSSFVNMNSYTGGTQNVTVLGGNETIAHVGLLLSSKLSLAGYYQEFINIAVAP